jgi:hypothetical protein
LRFDDSPLQPILPDFQHKACGKKKESAEKNPRKALAAMTKSGQE